MNASHPAYWELIDFIARGFSVDEQAELDYFFQLEHILRVAKARAERILARA
jgi:hypothetical protein